MDKCRNRLFDLHAFAEYGKEGVLALFQDSTNVERKGYTPSERADLRAMPPLDSMHEIYMLRAQLDEILSLLERCEDEDRKVKLEERVTKLAGVTFHQKLGTMAQKQERNPIYSLRTQERLEHRFR